MAKPLVPFLRSPYNYDRDAVSNDTGLECLDPSLAQQHMEPDTNINRLVEKYLVSGEVPQLRAPPMQGDFTEVMNYQDALNLMIEARQSFEALPAKLRNRFDNDAALFVDFCSQEENRDEMRQMGLWSKEAAAEWEKADQAERTRLEALQKDGEAFRREQERKAEQPKAVS